jgi:peptide/nickel transport system permease protein
MTAYLIRRMLQMVIVLIISSITIYMLLNLAPGGPFDQLRTMSDRKSRVSEEQIDKMEALLGLNKPIQMRYIAWLLGDDWMGSINPEWEGDTRGVLRGDFGDSFRQKRPVMDMIKDRIPKTIALTAISALLAMIVAIPVGIYSAVRQYSRVDYVLTFFTFMGVAIPSFWFGLMSIIIFAQLFQSWGLPALPSGGWESLRTPREGTVLGVLGAEPGSFLDVGVHLILPIVVLSLLQMAGWTRYMRTSMLEVLQQDYVRTARAKGLAERFVVGKHALRNALIPLVTIVTYELPFIFGGTILIEQVFGIPGMGLLYIDALNGFDFPVTQAYLLITAVLTVIATLLSDVLYTVVDPRIRLH